MVKDTRETLGADDKQVGLEGVPLSKPPRGCHFSDSVSVNFEGVRYRGNAFYNQPNPIPIEAHGVEDSLQIRPFDPIISFDHIKFESSVPLLAGCVSKPMHTFISYEDIVCNRFAQDKTLLGVDDVAQGGSESVSDCPGNNLVGDIAKANRTTIHDEIRFLGFGY